MMQQQQRDIFEIMGEYDAAREDLLQRCNALPTLICCDEFCARLDFGEYAARGLEDS